MIPTVTNPMGISPAYSRRLQYIASTGTQYIDTGYLFDARNKGSELEIKFYLPAQAASPNSSNFGARGPSNNALYSNLDHIRVGEGSSGQSYFSVITREQEHVFTFRNGIFSVDGVETDTGFLPSLGYTFDLFTFNAVGNHTTYLASTGTRIYYCKFSETGTLVQYLIPVIDKSGVPCLYDTVTRTLKYNAGTGTFDYDA